MTYDYVFKSVLSENKEYLARILSNILNIDKEYILDNLVYKNTEHTKLSKKDKRKISDLIVEVENMKINLEMNKGYYKSLTHKNNMYIYRLILGSIKEKEEYIDYDKMIIQVNFDVKWKFRDKLITKFEMIEKETGKKRCDYIESNDPIIYHVNLSKIKDMYYNKDKLNTFERELALMILDNKRELKEVSEGDDVMDKVNEKICKLSDDEILQGIYVKEEMESWMKKVDLKYAKEEGIKEGKKEGLKEGLLKGKKEANMETAIKLLKKGMEIKDIIDITGITKKQIEILRKSL